MLAILSAEPDHMARLIERDGGNDKGWGGESSQLVWQGRCFKIREGIISLWTGENFIDTTISGWTAASAK